MNLQKMLLEFTAEEYKINILLSRKELKELIQKEKILKSSNFFQSFRIGLNRMKITAIRQHILLLRKYQKIAKKLTSQNRQNPD